MCSRWQRMITQRWPPRAAQSERHQGHGQISNGTSGIHGAGDVRMAAQDRLKPALLAVGYASQASPGITNEPTYHWFPLVQEGQH